MLKEALKKTLPYILGTITGLILIGIFDGFESVKHTIFPIFLTWCLVLILNTQSGKEQTRVSIQKLVFYFK